MSQIQLHHGDLPSHIRFTGAIAVDTETMGLNVDRDRLCLVQIADADKNVHLVKFAPYEFDAPHLKKVMADDSLVKIFHYARFDMGAIKAALGVMPYPVYCTKIASYLVRTYSDKHGLRELARELAGVDLNKTAQSSDWGREDLKDDQQAYAAQDVLHLHELRETLDTMLMREERLGLYQATVEFLPVRVMLDLAGFTRDIYAHS